MSNARKSESYVLPGEVAIALQTGRPKLVDPLIARLKAGEVLPNEQVIGMIQAYQSYIFERDVEKNNLDQARLIEKAIEDHVKGLQGKLDELEALREAMHDGEKFDVAEYREQQKLANG